MTEKHVFDDLDALRSAGGEGEKPQRTKSAKSPPWKRRRKPGFISLPADWIEALKQVAPHPPWGMALYLVQRFIRERDEDGKRVRTLVVSNGNLMAWRIGRHAKVRDLQAIEAAGLIKVELLDHGQSPRVTWIVDPQG